MGGGAIEGVCVNALVIMHASPAEVYGVARSHSHPCNGVMVRVSHGERAQLVQWLANMGVDVVVLQPTVVPPVAGDTDD